MNFYIGFFSEYMVTALVHSLRGLHSCTTWTPRNNSLKGQSTGQCMSCPPFLERMHWAELSQIVHQAHNPQRLVAGKLLPHVHRLW